MQTAQMSYLTRANLKYKPYIPVDSLVYLLKGYKAYKIGYSTHFKKRLTELQIGNEHLLEIICIIETKHPKILEKQLHKQFKSKRIRADGEWFYLSKEDIEYIRSLCDKEDIVVN